MPRPHGNGMADTTAPIGFAAPLVSSRVFRSELMTSDTMRLSRVDVFPSALRRHIPCVVCAGSQKQMSRVHARRIVAMMTDKKSVRYRAVVQFLREPVGENELPSRSREHKHAIARHLVGRPRPHPATSPERGMQRAILIDLLPEPFSRCLARSQRIIPHHEKVAIVRLNLNTDTDTANADAFGGRITVLAPDGWP